VEGEYASLLDPTVVAAQRNATPMRRLASADDVAAAVIDRRSPVDRNGTFEPKLVPKGAQRLAGFNEPVISMYTREISVHG
jgi:transposase-like protein